MSKIEIKYNKEEPQSYDAYVYAYHIDETGKEYLGYHVGRFDETYQHSCENPEFIGDLANSKKVLFTLIDFGSKFDMINLEHKLLKKVDARNQKINAEKNAMKKIFDESMRKQLEDLKKEYDAAKTGGQQPTT